MSNEKVHTTNYYNTFIGVATDCPVLKAEIPPYRGEKKTAAYLQLEIISKNPYRFTSDDVLFQVFAERNDLTEVEYKEAREHFFSKGQPCLRASPLTKRYGWGIHYNNDGRIAIVGSETNEYQTFITDQSLTIIKAMRSSK